MQGHKTGAISKLGYKTDALPTSQTSANYKRTRQQSRVDVSEYVTGSLHELIDSATGQWAGVNVAFEMLEIGEAETCVARG